MPDETWICARCGTYYRPETIRVTCTRCGVAPLCSFCTTTDRNTEAKVCWPPVCWPQAPKREE